MSLLSKPFTMNRAPLTKLVTQVGRPAISTNALRAFSVQPTPIVRPDSFPTMPPTHPFSEPHKTNNNRQEVILQPLLGEKLGSPFAYTGVPSTTTVNPRYEIFESMYDFQVNMDIPEGLDPQVHLQIKVNDDAKAFQVRRAKL